MNRTVSRPALLLDLGVADYLNVWRLQRRLVRARSEGLISDALILVEHPPVFTMGRKANEENILSRTLPVYYIERGGDVTYHGPGQIVGYPIIKLDEGRLDLRRYLRSLEEVLIGALRDWDLGGERSSRQTGVWLNGKKIASIGIAVQRWVCFHGFALNVNTSLRYFDLIRPCGLEGQVMTSMKDALGHEVDLRGVKDSVLRHFQEVFEVELRATSEAALPLPYPEEGSPANEAPAPADQEESAERVSSNRS